MRSSRATLGWSWEERRWSERGSPRRGADDGGTGRRLRFSGDAGRVKSDRGASVGRGQARGGFDLGRNGPGWWLHRAPAASGNGGGQCGLSDGPGQWGLGCRGSTGGGECRGLLGLANGEAEGGARRAGASPASMAGGAVCYWRSPAGSRARGGALPFYSCSEGGRSWAHASWGRAAWCSSSRGVQ